MKKNNIGYQIIRPLLKLFSIIFLRYKILHKERIPKSGGYILAGNHVGYLDPIIIGNATPRTLHFLGKKELIDIPVLGKILRFMGVIPVDRKAKSNPKVKEEVTLNLQNNNVICIYPEGTTKKKLKENEYILPFKYGAVSFSKKSGCPIIPFAYSRKTKIFRRTILTIGKPFYVTEDIEKSNKELEEIVIKLIKEGQEYGTKK